MANWKKVDADQLDADLTTVADAIRERADVAEELAFPDGFVNAVNSIPLVDGLLDGTETDIYNNRVTKLRDNCFNSHMGIVNVNFPNVTSIGKHAFNGCKALKTIHFPKLTKLGERQFYDCSDLLYASFPEVSNLDGYQTFSYSGLQTLDFHKLSSITSGSMQNAQQIAALVLRKVDSICTLSNTSHLNNTKIASGNGYIYVPRALVDSYKSATNWSTYANQFRALEDYTVDGTTTGELDETKI